MNDEPENVKDFLHQEKQILPFGDRITITDPPVEPQRKDKILLPPGVDVDMKRAIIIAVGTEVEGDLMTGDAVYYACNHNHTVIRDTTFIHESCVVAWEKLSLAREEGGD